MTIPSDLLAAFLLGIGTLAALQSLYAILRNRQATPREPNPEPGPRVTPQSLKTAGDEWGRKFEASAMHKIGGLKGLHLEREGILEALRLCRGELKAMRAERVKAGYDDEPCELDEKYAEFLAYTDRLKDVDQDIEEFEQ